MNINIQITYWLIQMANNLLQNEEIRADGRIFVTAYLYASVY